MNYAKMALYVAVLGVFTAACGGDDENDNDPRFRLFSGRCSNVRTPSMPYMQTVKGTDPSGATVNLLLYGDGGNNVEIIGEVRVPSLMDIGLGSSGSIRECVDGEGQLVGAVTGTYDEIRFQLRGGRIQLSDGAPVTPTINNKFIVGDLYLEVNGLGGATLLMEGN
jgi:hypothetical protein